MKFLFRKDFSHRLFLPSREDELLLKAALLSKKGALLSWEKWISSVDLNHIDQNTFRLIPLAVHNLEKMGIKHSSFNRMRGTQKKFWYRNQLFFRSLKKVLAAFQDNNIKCMLLKGAALIPLYYKNIGIRPMNDIDLLITPESVFRACAVLEDAGWIWEKKMQKRITGKLVNVHNECLFKGGKATFIDLHWHAVTENVYPDADADFWHNARSFGMDGVNVYVMNPTDQLLFTCIHALKHITSWDSFAPANWVADAVYILRKDREEIDFDALLGKAEEHKKVLPLKICLGYLERNFGIQWPPDFKKRLAAAKISSLEEREFKTRQIFSSFLGPFLMHWYKYRRYVEREKKPPFLKKMFGFLLFLKTMYKIPSVICLPPILLFNTFRKIIRKNQQV
ncbi:MAG: nucleotidyltransferase family protein [Candidatus Aminicenantes bacterium]|nr:nucleotidyltransferase family protein [Candidatus Aminicenantes bacterium]